MSWDTGGATGNLSKRACAETGKSTGCVAKQRRALGQAWESHMETMDTWTQGESNPAGGKSILEENREAGGHYVCVCVHRGPL